MNPIGSASKAALSQPITTRTTETHRDVQTSRQTRTERDARIEITQKTSTQTTTETTKTRRQLEAQIRALNKKLDEIGQKESQFQISEGDQANVKYVHLEAGRSLEMHKSLSDFMDTPATEQSGLVIDTLA